MNASRCALAALALALALAGAEARAEPREGSVIAKSEKGAAAEGKAALAVTASVKGASIYVNRAYAGRTSYSSDSLVPGSCLVRVSAPGYSPLEYSLELVETMRISLHFVLSPLTGFIYFELSPEDAELLVDGRPVPGGSAELPVGRHEVTARRFGYEERRTVVAVREGAGRTLSLELPLAAFSIGKLRVERSSFNPANAGALGRAVIRFAATSYGSARLEIRDAAGALVGEADFPRLETWEQSYAWDGLGPGGARLPDGDYGIVVSAAPAVAASGPDAAPAAGDAGPVSLAASVRIDSSLVIRAGGCMAAMPGSLLFPDPRPQPAGVAAAELAWFFPSSGMSRSAFGFGSSLSLGGKAALGLALAAETSAEPEADLGLSLLVSLARKERLSLAAFARGSWSSADEPLLPGSEPGAELGLPLSLALGPLGLGLSPGLLVDLGSSSPEARPVARAGAWLSGPAYRASLSGALQLGGSGGALSLSWPAEICAEGRLILAPSPLVASAYALARIEPGAAPGFSFGLGLGFLL